MPTFFIRKRVEDNFMYIVQLFLLLFFVSSVFANDSALRTEVLPPGIAPIPAITPLVQPSSVEKIAPGIFRIGEIVINKHEKSISFPAQVNMDKGLLEYLLVRNGGKTHESLLRTLVEPYNLQLACLLLGLEGTSRPLAFQGAPENPTGDMVELRITHADKGGKPINIRPEEWLATMQESKATPVKNLALVYTGSIINEGRFLAQLEGSMIALYHDPVAIVDNASPGGEIHSHWAIREGTVPAVGTTVTVTIRPKGNIR